jgi:hypothetical protein
MKKLLISASFLAFPMVAFAQVSNINDVLLFVYNFLNALIPILIAAAVVYFLYGLIRYVVASDEAARGEARNIILYGIIVLTVMIAVWGLVNILINTFGIGNNAAPTGPQAPAPRPATAR